jgi:hypothetical protein
VTLPNGVRAAHEPPVRAGYPADFTVSHEQALQWHRQQVKECERRQQWTAALFHYDQLLAALPHDPDLRQQRAHAATLADTQSPAVVRR